MARRRRRWAWVGRSLVAPPAVLFACLSYSWLTLPDVRPLRTNPPDRTAFMALRAAEAARAGRQTTVTWHWVPYREISPNLRRAVLVAEDAAFWNHDGVDYDEVRNAIRAALETGRLPRGASTLTQQLAKNLYLSPSRNPYRKLIELMITRRLEAELGKTRIFELYLNVVEWGDDIWGAEAAARAYFGRSAGSLTASQAALMAGALINPRVYSPAHPNARLRARQRIILGRMGAGRASEPTSASRPTSPAEPTSAEDGNRPGPATGPGIRPAVPLIQLPPPPDP